MSAIKEFHHDEIEQCSRMFTELELATMHYLHAQKRAVRLEPKYNILQLSAMKDTELIAIAGRLGCTVGDTVCKLKTFYSILHKQAEL
jgi:hypothetical protein